MSKKKFGISTANRMIVPAHLVVEGYPELSRVVCQLLQHHCGAARRASLGIEISLPYSSKVIQ
jgi:hypothetical protein